MSDNKLAIVILGEQGSGKSSTLRRLLDMKQGQRLCDGWKHIILKGERVDFYLINSSPPEKGAYKRQKSSLRDILCGVDAPILVMANQYCEKTAGGGQEYDPIPTFEHLEELGYTVKILWLNPGQDLQSKAARRSSRTEHHNRYYDYAGIASFCHARGHEVTLANGNQSVENAVQIKQKIWGWSVQA